MTVTNEITFNVNVEDKPSHKNTKIWHKPGKKPKMGKTLDQFFLLLLSNVQQRKREYNQRLANMKIKLLLKFQENCFSKSEL